MILRLALRELWHAKTALLLQVASLTVAIAALSASAQLNAQTQGGPIPGARCGDEVLEVTGRDGDNKALGGWTPRQTRALMTVMGATPAAETMRSIAIVQTAVGQEQFSVEFVGPAYFDALCVVRRDTLGAPVTKQFTEGAVAEAATFERMSIPRDVQIDASALGVASTTDGFNGVQFKSNPTRLWVPMSVAIGRGQLYLDANFAELHILVRPTPADTNQQIQKRLEAALRDQPTLFSGVAGIQLGPILQIGAQTAQRVGIITTVLRLFAGALLLLATLNLMTYHVGRLPVAQALATTLAALGVPPSAVWSYAAIEPAVVGLMALLAGSALSAPLAYMAVGAVTNEATSIDLHGGWQTLLIPGFVAAIISGSIVAIRGRILTRRQSPSRNRAQRLLLRWLPPLLTMQVALAALTLTLAAQATAGLYKALPPLPNFPLEGLSVVHLALGENQSSQEHIQLRWASAWGAKQPGGYDAALATSPAPFLPTWGNIVTIANRNQSARGYIQYVTANFFEVLGTPLPQGRVFSQGADPRAAVAELSGAPKMVLSKMAESEINAGGASDGMVLRYSRELDAHPDATSPSAVVVGVFDDGIVGARGAVGKFNLSALSMQAAIPLVYQSMDTMRVRDGSDIRVFVRHPIGSTNSQIVGAVMPAVNDVFPGAEVLEVDSAMTLYRNPLRKERAMALVLALLAISSLAIGLLGMISLMTMLLRSLKIELAVRHAVGATRRQVAGQMARQLVMPAAVGLLMGALPAAGGVYLLGQTLETAARAGLWGPALGLLFLGAACAAVVFQSTRIVMEANFMDWLRYE